MNFKHWLLSENMHSKLAIFDFDDTLAQTPKPPENWKGGEYIAPDGKPRKSSDWWVHPDSLQGSWNFNDLIVQEFQKARSDPNTHAVLLTGRVGMRTAHIIRGKLRDAGLFGKRVISPNHSKALKRHQEWPYGDDRPDDSHEEFFKGDMQKEPDYPKLPSGQPSSDTFDHKTFVIEKKLMNDGIQEIDFWDDRSHHREGFVKLFQKMLQEWPNLQRVTFHVVTPQGINPIFLTKNSN